MVGKYIINVISSQLKLAHGPSHIKQTTIIINNPKNKIK